MTNKKILVLFSSGIDSTSVLYWAKNNYDEVFAMIFDYDQKHNIETKMAKKIVEKLNIKYKLINFSLKDISLSALIDEEKTIPESLSKSKNDAGVPFTYVPFRNGIFLSLAAAFAESNEIFDIATGFNLIDTPDYPDTTEAFTKKMEAVINQGTSASITGKKFKIITPLINKTKSEIIQFGLENGADFSYSISCYRGDEMPCGKCPSCEIRSNAFKELDIKDPLIERLENH
jgi:7-cyano-7-deazaguanine synthase